MIYLFSGTDTKKKNQALEGLLKKIKPAFSKDQLFSNVQNEDMLNEMISANSLFGDGEVYILDSVLNEENNFIFKNIKRIQSSSNVFIFNEEYLTKSTLSKVEKFAERVFCFDEIKKTLERFNIFSLTNALGARDKKTLWVLLQIALREESPEAIVGVLFWKIKDMLLKGSGKFTTEEVKTLSLKLATLLVDARRKNLDSEIELEKFILKYV